MLYPTHFLIVWSAGLELLLEALDKLFDLDGITIELELLILFVGV